MDAFKEKGKCTIVYLDGLAHQDEADPYQQATVAQANVLQQNAILTNTTSIGQAHSPLDHQILISSKPHYRREKGTGDDSTRLLEEDPWQYAKTADEACFCDSIRLYEFTISYEWEGL